MSIYDIAKREFEKHYDSVMSVMENRPVKVGSVTKPKWLPVEGLENIPCRISKKSISPAAAGTYADATYQISLYCDPALDILAGSRINVTDTHGNVKEYERASVPFNSYRTHQEIALISEVMA